MGIIIQNAIRIKKYNVILISRTSTLEEYKGFSLDGGFDYQEINFPPKSNMDDIENLILYDDSTEKEIKNKLIWGTYGKSGKGKLKYIKLIDCETSHLEKILEIQTQRNNQNYILAIKSILKDRKNQERIDKIKELE